MKVLKVLCIAVMVSFAIILFSALTSFAAGEITKDDIKLLRDAAANLQQVNPQLAKQLNERADKVSAEQTRDVSEKLVQKPTPKITKELPSTVTLTPTKDFWLIDSPKEWPSQIMGGMRGGTQKLKGYEDNLIPLAGTKDALMFADVKTVLGASDTNEENIGFGARSLLFNEKLILGGNLFYDTKYTESKIRHNQLGFGLEGLSKWVDLRSNFYFPISGKQSISSGYTGYGFRSRSLVGINSYEEPLTGLDYEGGILIPYLSEYLETRAFIGGYNYFPSEGNGLNGIKGRIELRPVKALTINLELKKDNYNPTEFFVEGIVTVPLDTMNVFKITNPLGYVKDYLVYKKGIRPLRERMVDRVVRDIDVTSQPSTTESKVHDLTYVDNSNTGSSDGTLEHPYTTIQAGVDGVVGDKWVYVKEGSGNYKEAVTLANNVVLWGSGYNGGFSGLTTSGVYPVIDGEATRHYDITLGDGNTVMGLKATGALGAGIYSASANNATISHNIITSNIGTINNTVHLGAGILLVPDSGNLTATITDNTITDNTGYAMTLVSVSGTTLTTTLTNNTLTSNYGDGFASNGVITTDLGTGLIWASDGMGTGCYDGGTRTWAQAATWADGLDFGGYTDWRMPTIQELEAIVNYNLYIPTINRAAFPNTSSTYWSSTTLAVDAGYAWYVSFIDGVADYSLKTTTLCVRPVRGSQ
ncbi:MAG: DUF1566 domain-containing protein [Candidatus Omnitrophota bacterium]